MKWLLAHGVPRPLLVWGLLLLKAGFWLMYLMGSLLVSSMLILSLFEAGKGIKLDFFHLSMTILIIVMVTVLVMPTFWIVACLILTFPEWVYQQYRTMDKQVPKRKDVS